MTVKIYLKEKGTNIPIPFVNVRIIGDNGRDFLDDTDRQGLAEFKGYLIPQGRYTIKVRSMDFRPYTEKHRLNNNSVITLSLHPTHGFR